MSNSSVSSLFAPVVTGSSAASLSGASFSKLGSSIGDGAESGGFGTVLTSALNQVSGIQSSATQQVNSLLGGANVDMSKVMISVEKADVAFQLMMQVRNKIVNAYQDIEKMQF
jgi:flagellar hook-basal body complex protein FliE